MIILIPCKALDLGKSRLSTALDQHARRALCEFFLCRTLSIARKLTMPDQVHVVSADPKVIEIADRYGVSVLGDSSLDLNRALEEARAAMIDREADLEALLIMPIDLPLCSEGSLASVVTEPGDVVIVPDESGTGTNVLFLRQMAVQRLQFRFGPNSYQAHCELAKDAELTFQTVRDDRLSLDIDLPEQLWRWLRDARMG